jgi:hypothetical protein
MDEANWEIASQSAQLALRRLENVSLIRHIQRRDIEFNRLGSPIPTTGNTDGRAITVFRIGDRKPPDSFARLRRGYSRVCLRKRFIRRERTTRSLRTSAPSPPW